MFLKNYFKTTFLFRMAVKAGGKAKLTLIELSYQVAWLGIIETTNSALENTHKYLTKPALLTCQAVSGKFLTGLVAVRNGKLRMCLWMGWPASLEPTQAVLLHSIVQHPLQEYIMQHCTHSNRFCWGLQACITWTTSHCKSSHSSEISV